MKTTRLIAVFIVTVLLSGFAGHTGDRLSVLEQKLAEINAKLEALSAAGPSTEAATIEQLHAQVQALAAEIAAMRLETPDAASEDNADRKTSIGGYGELLYQDFDSRRDDGDRSGKTDTADLQRLVLYVGHRFTPEITFRSEIEYEHAVTGDDAEGEVALEMAHLDFSFGPRFNLRGGLVLVPVGLINETHEPPTFLGARRPDVERVILPTTWSELGVGAFGDIGPLSYRVYLTTALDASGFSADEGIRGGRQEGSKAKAEALALSARLDYRGAPGVLIGVSGYRGNSGQDQPWDATVTVLDLHADITWRGLNLRGLWARVRIGDAESISRALEQSIGSSQQGSYLQAGYDLLAASRWNRRALIPFVRSERVDTQREVATGFSRDDANRRRIVTYGVVFKPIPQIAIKTDFQDLKTGAGNGVDQFNVAIGFSF